MDRKRDKPCVGSFVLSVVLLVACTSDASPTPAVPQALVVPAVETALSTVLPDAIEIPPPTPTAEAVPLSTEFIDVTPSLTASAIRFAGWSPDSRWVVYWASSQEDVDSLPPAYTFPTGTLSFFNVDTGELCSLSEFEAVNREGDVHWSHDGVAIVITAAGAFTGQPCQPGAFVELPNYTLPESQKPDPAFSPDGRYRTITMLEASDSGVLIFDTTLMSEDDAQPLQRIIWKIDQRLGDYGLGGEWITQEKFLIYETLDEGPLVIDVERGVISVLSDLFGLHDIPSILDEGGYGWRAIAAPGMQSDAFHLLLTGVGLEGNFPSVMLYHAESGLAETLPYRFIWWQPFSADYRWLLIDKRLEEGGYEAHAIWIRQVDDVGGMWQPLAMGVDTAVWNADWTEMAFSDKGMITWQTFPTAQLIGRWNTNPYWTQPVAWSLDGRFLAALGNLAGQWRYGLFVFASPGSIPR